MTGRPRIRQAPDRSWMADGACRGKPAEMFFPAVDERNAKGVELYGIARRVCARCPVKDQCLEYALTNREVLGMWGGATPSERRAIAATRAARRRAAQAGELVEP